MTYSFHSDAKLELNASVDYYEACQVNLGAEFTYEALIPVTQSCVKCHAAYQTTKDKNE